MLMHNIQMNTIPHIFSDGEGRDKGLKDEKKFKE